MCSQFPHSSLLCHDNISSHYFCCTGYIIFTLIVYIGINLYYHILLSYITFYLQLSYIKPTYLINLILPFTHVRPLRSCVSDDRSLSERRSDHALVNSIKLIRMIFSFRPAFLDEEITLSRYTPSFLSSRAKEIGRPKQRYALQKSFPLQLLLFSFCFCFFFSSPSNI